MIPDATAYDLVILKSHAPANLLPGDMSASLLYVEQKMLREKERKSNKDDTDYNAGIMFIIISQMSKLCCHTPPKYTPSNI